MVNHIEGVSESDALQKQGGEARKASGEEPKKPADEYGEYEHKPQPKSKNQQGNESSRLKGKGKLVDDDDEEEEDQGAKLK